MAQLGRPTYHQAVTQSGALEAGRSTAIVLFTDLVGSTELRSRLGEDATDEVRRHHDRLVVGAVAAYRGRLVKNLGDGVMATFSGASDAVSAAVGIQQAIDRHNRAPACAVSLEVRIGLSAGDVACEEGDYFGTPVIEAARLCAAAHGGQILVTEVVRLLAGSGGGQQFTAVGTLDLKGLPAPVSTSEVAWEPLPITAVPMPAILTDVGRIFVGRDAQVEQLSQLWKEAAAGQLRVALLAGEPGVGKTRLAAEVAEAAHADGATVLAGRCDEDLGVPYQPFVEALRHFVDHTSPEDLAARLGRYKGELVRLVPELAERIPGLVPLLRSDPETERYRLFDAVAAWLVAASAVQPVLLMLDDLQWAAKPTLLLLRHVVRSAEPKQLLVLGTYRDTDLGHDHPLIELLADLRRHGAVERLSLMGLDSSSVVAFITLAAGHELDGDDRAFARAVYEETEGNPFFVREVLRHLAETGALQRQEDGWSVRLPLEEIGIPEGVREVVGRRLARLSKETNRVLQRAAVLGTEFELSVLVAAEGSLDEEDLLVAVEEATAARLVIEASGPNRYRFAHALVRDTIYRELSAARRTILHRQVAQAIEAVHVDHLDDQLPALAHHWSRASAPAADTAKAVDYAARAGDRALAQLAYDEAVAYYRQALELLAGTEGPAKARRLELFISLGDAQRRAGDPAHRETLLSAARVAQEKGDIEGLARAALANTRGILFSAVGSVDQERVAVLEAALEGIGETDRRLRARLLATLGLEMLYKGDRTRRVDLSDQALGLARSVDDPETLALVLLTRFYTIVHPSTLGERLANSAELLAAADRIEDPVTQCRAELVRFRAAVEAGDMPEADRSLDSGDRLACDLGQPILRWIIAYSRGGRALLSGDLDSAERFTFEALNLGDATGQPEARLFSATTLFGIRLEQGHLEEIEQTWAEIVTSYPGLRVALAMMGLLYTETGHDSQAKQCFEELANSDFGHIPPDNLWLQAMCHCATMCSHFTDQPRARLLTALLAPYSDQIAGTPVGWFGSVAHHLASLAVTLRHWEQAEEHFAVAEATHERIGAPTWLARTRLEWARMLLTRRQPGDEERAWEFRDQALASAREFGLGSVEWRAVQLINEQ